MSALSNPSPSPSASPVKPTPVNRPERPRSRGPLVIGVVGVVVLAGAYAGYRQYMSKPATPAAVAAKSAKAFTGPLEQTMRLSGQTSARNYANITTPIMRGPESRQNMVLYYLVASGQRVKQGDLLLQIDVQQLRDRIDDVRDNVQSSANDVLKRKADQEVDRTRLDQTIKVTKASWDKAELDFRTAEVKTEIEKQLLKLSVDEAAARYKQQTRDIEQKARAQQAELKILQISYDRSMRRITRFENDLKRFTVNSPMAGLAVVGSTFRGGEMGQFRQGDQVASGQPVLKVVDPSSMQVEATVSQADSGLLRMGQRVKIGLDAFPDLKFEGRIYSIGALAAGGPRSSDYVRTVPVRVTIEGADPRLIPDLSAYGDVVLESIPNQTQIPIGALEEADGKTWVSVRAGTEWVRREVTAGLRNHLYVSISKGINAGEEVRIP